MKLLGDGKNMRGDIKRFTMSTWDRYDSVSFENDIFEIMC